MWINIPGRPSFNNRIKWTESKGRNMSIHLYWPYNMISINLLSKDLEEENATPSNSTRAIFFCDVKQIKWRIRNGKPAQTWWIKFNFHFRFVHFHWEKKRKEVFNFRLLSLLMKLFMEFLSFTLNVAGIFVLVWCGGDWLIVDICRCYSPVDLPSKSLPKVQ